MSPSTNVDGLIEAALGGIAGGNDMAKSPSTNVDGLIEAAAAQSHHGRR